MAVVTGDLLHFMMNNLSDRAPILRWHPRSEKGTISIRNDWLLVHRPVDATITGAEWEINVAPTIGTKPLTWFEIQVIELDSDGNFTREYWWPSRVHVPPEGGDFAGLPGGPLSPESVWVGLTPPPDSWLGWWLYQPGPGEDMPLDDPDIGNLIKGPGPFIVGV